ncbi:MAG: hypothetical protein Q9208_001665, partial [Pyrenodesmia sp. 3 TL-2023]
MKFNRTFWALALSASFIGLAAAQDNGNQQDNNGDGNQDAAGDNNGQAVLDPDNIQAASASDGQGNAEGNKAGSCNGIPMGDIPATTNMVSTILTNPVGGCIPANEDFDITLQVANLNAGVFVNPTVAYYTAPQALENGNIVGHVHVTVQSLGDSLNPNQPLDAVIFAFFKGIDDNGDGNGGLKATVAGGLPAGFFRVCTMSAAANHQPVTMPVA